MAIHRPSGTRLLLSGIALIAVVGVALGARPRVISEPRLSPIPSFSLPPLRQGDLFVAGSGDDSATGSEAEPLATIQAAVDRAAGNATVWVAPGSYTGFELGRAAAPGQPITVAARATGTVTITPAGAGSTVDLAGATGVQLVNLVVQGPVSGGLDAIRLDHSANITIEGCVVRGTTGGLGIEVRYSANVTIRGNDVIHNAIGIRLYGEGDPGSVHDVLIEDNRIHDSDSMILNDTAPNNDYGANGIVWHKVTGRTIARGNQVWSNRAPSHDYGVDGGAFEIWGSSNAEIVDNVAWDNVNVMETGSDGPECENNAFVRNVAYAFDAGVGLILRCAHNALIANNVLDHLHSYAFELSDRSGGNSFATSIDGLRIVNNIVVGSLAYAIRNPLPDSVTLDYNLLPQRRAIAAFPRGVTSTTIAAFTKATGQESHSLSGDPLFVDRTSHDYRIQPGSPAIDRGTVLNSGDQFRGVAPDIGAYEGATVLPSPTPSARASG